MPIYVDQKPVDGKSLPPIEIKVAKVSTASVEQGKAELSTALTTWYWCLVGLAGACMFGMMGWREFLVVPAAIGRAKLEAELASHRN